ncbi:hypothetical protein ACFVQB_23555 [Paenibacillus sp. NPDC057886]|uniref:hypothetical protein n=1 Tax=Paenibacillus sp. NPDC057886 TaxID=3346270 RepID=UPI003687E0C9
MEAVDAIHSEAVRMKEMTEQLLLLAKPDRHWEISPVKIDLCPWMEQIVAGFHRAYNREIQIEVSSYEPIQIYTDADKLRV